MNKRPLIDVIPCFKKIIANLKNTIVIFIKIYMPSIQFFIANFASELPVSTYQANKKAILSKLHTLSSRIVKYND
jgi:hypothetical protein